MVLRTEAALPTRLKVHVTVRETKRPSETKKAKKVREAKARDTQTPSKPGLDLAIPLLDLFREEFFVALGQALRWTDEDAQEFWHDLELYENLTAHEAARASKAAAAAPSLPDRSWTASRCCSIRR